jgi:hypothetical protein
VWEREREREIKRERERAKVRHDIYWENSFYCTLEYGDIKEKAAVRITESEIPFPRSEPRYFSFNAFVFCSYGFCEVSLFQLFQFIWEIWKMMESSKWGIRNCLSVLVTHSKSIQWINVDNLKNDFESPQTVKKWKRFLRGFWSFIPRRRKRILITTADCSWTLMVKHWQKNVTYVADLWLD